MIRTGLLIAGSAIVLAGCSSAPRQPAPIVDGMVQPVTPAPAPVAAPAPAPMVNTAPTHTVQSGDTLYRIAKQYGVAVVDIQSWNQLPDTTIRLGQTLIVGQGGSAVAAQPGGGVTIQPLNDGGSVATAPATPAVPPNVAAPAPVLAYPKAVRQLYSEGAAATVAQAAEGQNVATQSQKPTPSVGLTPTPVAAVPPTPQPPTPTPARTATESGSANAAAQGGNWVRPANGKVIRTFTPDSKGIDIAGKLGDPVNASGSGKVVYAGAGLRGYGNMVILKHDDEFLTAYAHASKLLVKEGETVRQGQKIAEMGNSDTDQVKLHFEIRRYGKPVDPGAYLKTD
ncbi:peptidoglycan DD-metalloendopeptidase family protein [Chitinibacteraceae bacterium HSL-7]